LYLRSFDADEFRIFAGPISCRPSESNARRARTMPPMTRRTRPWWSPSFAPSRGSPFYREPVGTDPTTKCGGSLPMRKGDAPVTIRLATEPGYQRVPYFGLRVCETSANYEDPRREYRRTGQKLQVVAVADRQGPPPLLVGHPPRAENTLPSATAAAAAWVLVSRLLIAARTGVERVADADVSASSNHPRPSFEKRKIQSASVAVLSVRSAFCGQPAAASSPNSPGSRPKVHR